MNYKNSLLTLTLATITATSCAPMYTQPKILVINRPTTLEEITINNYYLTPGSQFMIRGSRYYFDRFDSRSSMYFFYTSGPGQRIYFSWNLNILDGWARQGYFHPYVPQIRPPLIINNQIPYNKRPFNKYNQPHKNKQNTPSSNSRRTTTNNKTPKKQSKRVTK
jgi:hypothetical protein